MTTRKGECQPLDDYTTRYFANVKPRAYYRSVSYRIDMLHVLDKRESAAIIYQVVFRWLTYRQETILREIKRRRADRGPALTIQDVDDRMWISLSYNDFVRETGGAISYNTVVAVLEYLVTTKGVLRRRTSRNPRFSDYEYSIERQHVCALLTALPETPHVTPKRSKTGPLHHSPTSGSACPISGPVQAQEAPPTSGWDAPTSGPVQAQEAPPISGWDAPISGPVQAQEAPPISGWDAPTSGPVQAQEAPPTSGWDAPTSGWGHPTSGPAGSQKRDPSQRRTDSFSQRNTLQQQQRDVSEKRSAAAAAPMISPQSFSQDDVALVAVSRQDAAPSTSTASQQCPSADAFVAQAQQLEEQAPAISDVQPAKQGTTQAQQLDTQVPAVSDVQTAKQTEDEVLTEERIVEVFERLRGRAYDQSQRARERAAARAVLRLPLPVPLSVSWLERVYTTFNDDWFRTRYGSLEVHHLSQRELTGQIRIIRWIHRLIAQDARTKKETLARQRDALGARLIAWEGQMLRVEDAHQRGYQGGFELFKQPEYPDDDLIAAAAVLAAQGKLATAPGAALGGTYERTAPCACRI
jgi:hypothetical protein